MNRTIFVGFSILVLVIYSSTIFGQQSALASLAQSMAPGTWAELQTNNINPVLSANGASGIIFGFTESIKWDPVSKKLFYVGGDHNDTPKFVSYTESSNSWQELSRQGWMQGTMHGYDHHCINIQDGLFYHRPFFNNVVRRYNISNNSWSNLPALSMANYINEACGLAYFPEIQSILLATREYNLSDGSIFKYSEVDNLWSRLGIAGGYQMGGNHNFVEYNPVHKVVVFGGGNGYKTMYKLDENENISMLNNAPEILGVQSSIFTVDPVSGDYLIFTSSGKFYVYNVITDNWLQKSGSIPIWTTVYGNPIHGVVSSPCNSYGIVIFISCNGNNNCKFFVYKHTNSNITPPSKPAGLLVRP